MDSNEWKYTSLETSKELDRLGLKAGGERWWGECKSITEIGVFYFRLFVSSIAESRKSSCPELKQYPAYDCAELGRLLPSYLKINGESKTLTFQNIMPPFGTRDFDFYCFYLNEKMEQWAEETGNTEAECRGKMLIHLIKNKHIDIETLNEMRLLTVEK